MTGGSGLFGSRSPLNISSTSVSDTPSTLFGGINLANTTNTSPEPQDRIGTSIFGRRSPLDLSSTTLNDALQTSKSSTDAAKTEPRFGFNAPFNAPPFVFPKTAEAKSSSDKPYQAGPSVGLTPPGTWRSLFFTPISVVAFDATIEQFMVFNPGIDRPIYSPEVCRMFDM
jgi:hypothetical protein